MLGYVEVEDLAVVGSGDYERYFIHDGKRYHHIFQPKTGCPAEGMTAAWILHPDPLVAQGHCSTIFILGPDRGMRLVEKIPGMEAIMVTSSGEMFYSAGLKHALQAIPKPK
jgi:thiamine biosynthesis lipoprotein